MENAKSKRSSAGILLAVTRRWWRISKCRSRVSFQVSCRNVVIFSGVQRLVTFIITVEHANINPAGECS